MRLSKSTSKKNFKYLNILVFILSLFGFLGCDTDKKKKKNEDEKEPEAVIVQPPERIAKLTMLPVQIPNGRGGFMAVSELDFRQGVYPNDIMVGGLPTGLSAAAEDAKAEKSGIFLYGPGLLWSLVPPVPVDVTLTARGRSKTIRKSPGDNMRLAVSLMNFPDIFPPAYRERYELKISSIPGMPAPFSYTYFFTVKKIGSTSVVTEITPIDSVEKLYLGRDTIDFKFIRIGTKEKCDTCTIEALDVKITASVKKFTELPAIPQPGRMRISKPSRFSGLLIETESKEITPTVVGNNTGSVTISAFIPGSISIVTPWCRHSTGVTGGEQGDVDFLCSVNRRGVSTPTYFRFVNAVPTNAEENIFGGTSGISKLSLSGSAKITVSRDGEEIEKRTITFDSGEATPLNQPLPGWVLDDLRSALGSGAGEFLKN